MLVYTVYEYIYIYTYIYTISGLFFGSTVVALGVRMYWKSELKILICLGAVNPQRWRWNHIPEFNGPYDAGWDIQHPNIALYIARVLYPWAYQPIPNLNQTLHRKNTSFNFYINFFSALHLGQFFRGSEIKDATCFARIHHLRYIQIYLPLSVWKPPTLGNESQWR